MRIQIELPEGDVTTLKNLMADANIETYKDLFKNALLLLYWAVREVRNGRIIASVRGEEVDESDISCKQIVMPILDHLARVEESPDPEQSGEGETFARVVRNSRTGEWVVMPESAQTMYKAGSSGMELGVAKKVKP